MTRQNRRHALIKCSETLKAKSKLRNLGKLSEGGSRLGSNWKSLEIDLEGLSRHCLAVYIGPLALHMHPMKAYSEGTMDKHGLSSYSTRLTYRLEMQTFLNKEFLEVLSYLHRNKLQRD